MLLAFFLILDVGAPIKRKETADAAVSCQLVTEDTMNELASLECWLTNDKILCESEIRFLTASIEKLQAQRTGEEELADLWEKAKQHVRDNGCFSNLALAMSLCGTC